MNQNLPNLAAVLQFFNGSEIASTHNHLTIEKYSKLHRQRLWSVKNKLIEGTTNATQLPNGLLNPSHRMTNDSLSQRPRRQDIELTRILVVGYQSRSGNGLGQQSPATTSQMCAVRASNFTGLLVGKSWVNLSKCQMWHLSRGRNLLFGGGGTGRPDPSSSWYDFLNGIKLNTVIPYSLC